MTPMEARRLAGAQGPPTQPPQLTAPPLEVSEQAAQEQAAQEQAAPERVSPEEARERDEERRRRLAEAQGRVVAALVAGAEVPEGFDLERMRAQAVSLVSKRRAIVARLRPDAAAAAGPDLAAEFAAYARARATPPPGYRADADDFAAWLRERGRMPGEPPPKRRWWSRLPGIR
ncbi:hypothetical protein [[Actinomadura] parvosata]|uniref:hypothetical protein n=1 Tax=[Actinomadura] parvosata TaxID=1955412 RepID=UPI001C92717F|nr:hypothetical protein [Nonomuraea sp. ATCC 55076]